MIVTILIFIVILGLLVFVHEAGHFFAAKRSGMKVDEFGFGFPPRLLGIYKTDGKWQIVWGNRPIEHPEGTVYSINAIPLGGFVKIVGEDNEAADDPRSFINKPFWPRLMTLIAGVVMNVVLAWVLLSIGYMYGLPAAIEDLNNLPNKAHFEQRHPAITAVLPNSPAEKSGLKPQDIILAIDGNDVVTVQDAQSYVLQHKGQRLMFTVQRISEVVQVSVSSNANPGPDSGPTGIALNPYGRLSFPWYAAISQGFQTIVYQIGAIASGLYHLIFAGQGLKDVGGVVKIAQLTGQFAQLGFISLLQFTAFLSLNLAILNILPIPALDGGRVLFLIIEKLRGKRNNQRWEQIANTVGFLALLLLMLVITAHDILHTSIVSKIIG